MVAIHHKSSVNIQICYHYKTIVVLICQKIENSPNIGTAERQENCNFFDKNTLKQSIFYSMIIYSLPMSRERDSQTYTSTLSNYLSTRTTFFPSISTVNNKFAQYYPEGLVSHKQKSFAKLLYIPSAIRQVLFFFEQYPSLIFFLFTFSQRSTNLMPSAFLNFFF